MSIISNDIFAMAEFTDANCVSWFACSRSKMGTFVVRDKPDAPEIDGFEVLIGGMFNFTNAVCERYDRDGWLLFMTLEQRAALGMDDETYQALNLYLREDRRTRR